MGPACTDEEFIRLFNELGARDTARHLGVTDRAVYSRRRRLEMARGEPIHGCSLEAERFLAHYQARIPIEIGNGIALIGSDAHYWPGLISTAHRGFVYLIKELQPALICLNGDVKDGATNSRHPATSWNARPSLREERDAVEERLTEIESAAGKASLEWAIGNHDARFEARLAQQVPEYRGLDGFALKDLFPKWRLSMSLWLNNEVVVKHRYKGGEHATHNNTLRAGKTIITGHLHSLKVTPFDDYNGTRWGVDTGTLADPRGPQFDYDEDNPKNHRSGFIVLTFHNYRLLWPEIAYVIDSTHLGFRGQIITV